MAEHKEDTTSTDTVTARKLGLLKDEIQLSEEFFEPLTDDELSVWE